MDKNIAEEIADCFQQEGRSGRQTCIDLAESEGLRHIGRGKAREVFTDGDHVLKTVRHGGGICTDENRTEVEWWDEVEGTTLGSHFAEIHEYSDDYRWITMDYYGESPSLDDIQETEKKIKRSGAQCPDMNTGNFRQDEDGNTVLVDYGQGCF